MVSNSEILDGTLEHAIDSYLEIAETKEAMLAKFKGDKVELIKFLRDRDYKEWIKTNKEPADISGINKKIDDLIKQHKENVADGSLKLYDTDPRSKPKVDDAPVPEPIPEPETKSTVKYVEPDTGKRNWNKKSKKVAEKKSSEGSQSSLF